MKESRYLQSDVAKHYLLHNRPKQERKGEQLLITQEEIKDAERRGESAGRSLGIKNTIVHGSPDFFRHRSELIKVSDRIFHSVDKLQGIKNEILKKSFLKAAFSAAGLLKINPESEKEDSSQTSFI